MSVDKACDNKNCMKSDECLRHLAFLNGDENYKTFKGTEVKACGQFIQK